MNYPLVVLSILLSLIACQKQKASSDLDLAAKVHDEIIDRLPEVERNIANLRLQANQIQVQGRTLSESEIQHSHAIRALEARYHQWTENMTEVPGHEHEHTDGEHHHHHAPDPQLTDAQILTLQRELLKELDTIAEQSHSLMQTEL